MTAPSSVFALTSALAICAAAVTPALANPIGDTLPGGSAMSFRVMEMSGGGYTQVVYSPDCAPMRSPNFVHKGGLAAPRFYGETRALIRGGDRVVGWDGGRECGSAYESGTAPRSIPLASNE